MITPSTDTLAPHPVGTSHFTDGQVPNAPQRTPGNPDDRIYFQPTVEVQQVAEGATIKDAQSMSLCQRLADEQNPPTLTEWFQRHKGTLGLIGLGYLTVRIVTRRKH